MKKSAFLVLLSGPVAAQAQTAPMETSYQVVVQQISEQQFAADVASATKYKQPALTVVDDEAKAYALLKGKATVVTVMQDGMAVPSELTLIASHNPAQPKHYEIGGCVFQALYPQAQRLIFTCAHGSDLAFDLNSGNTIDEHPAVRVYSPNEQWRTTGFYYGSWAASFIQHWRDGQWRTLALNQGDQQSSTCILVNAADGSDNKDQVCSNFSQVQWLSNQSWVYFDYIAEQYYRAEIVTHPTP